MHLYIPDETTVTNPLICSRGSFHGSLRHLDGAELPENREQEPGRQQVTKVVA